ncbi:hypothetical protein Syun_009146 [Stephania yunnanensis]|uniref:Uncharacterized protein n=1 Tax=Stephania yunnanensis TaxID=152371 RepID=A0AAP0KE40_9MAGN
MDTPKPTHPRLIRGGAASRPPHRVPRRGGNSLNDPVKPVRRITVRLAAASAGGSWNLTSRFADVVVERRPDDEYVVAVGVAGGEQWEKGEVVGAIERGVAVCGCGTAALRRRRRRRAVAGGFGVL